MTAIQTSEILFKLSGGSSNADPNAAIGGAMSSTQLVDNTIDNLFDDVTGDENAALTVEYRAIYVQNNNASNTWKNVKAWLAAEVAGGANIAIGVPVQGAGAALPTLADENTAPEGVSFSSPTTKLTGLDIGDIPVGSFRGLWIRRTATNSAAMSNDSATIRCEGDTGAL